MVHKIAIFDAFKWNKLPLHRSIYHTVKFYKSPYQTYKNKSRGEGRVHYIHFISNLFPGSSLFAPSKKRERGAWERDFGIRYFWEFKRNLTNVCRFPIWWVINRSLKIYFCFNICVTYVHSLWCRNVAVSDKGKQLETAFIIFIGCHHASSKQKQKLSKTKTDTTSHHDRDLRIFPEIPAVIRLTYHGNEGIPEETQPASCISTIVTTDFFCHF